MTRGHAESAIKTTNGKVSVALTADRLMMCLMLLYFEVLQLMLRPVVLLLHTLAIASSEIKTACQTQNYDFLGSADECSRVSTSHDRQHGKWLKFDCLALGGGWQAGGCGLGHG